MYLESQNKHLIIWNKLSNILPNVLLCVAPFSCVLLCVASFFLRHIQFLSIGYSQILE